MKTIYSEKILRITKNKARLEKALKVKITNKGKEVSIDGKPEDEYIAEKTIHALNFGFPFSIAMLLKEEEFMFEIISIKDHTKRHDLNRIRARIIGKGGKTLKTLATLTNCHFELKDNEIGIIGPATCIKNTQQGIISIIQGSKQSNVYKYLEHHKPEPILDLGLKE